MIELAFIVSFATFFTKIWRLYKLFFNTDLKERVSAGVCISLV